jgi:hypothetical protein
MATAHESDLNEDRAELERRAASKAADPETRRWADEVNSMLTTASADGRIKELLKNLES